MKHKNGTPYADGAWKRWYSMRSSSELAEEREAYEAAQVEQIREDRIHNHGIRR